MTEIQNPKQLAFDPPLAGLDIVIWNLFVVWCLYFVISGLPGFSPSIFIFVHFVAEKYIPMICFRPVTANKFYPPHPDKP